MLFYINDYYENYFSSTGVGRMVRPKEDAVKGSCESMVDEYVDLLEDQARISIMLNERGRKSGFGPKTTLDVPKTRESGLGLWITSQS